jgi:hypothetical protein
MAKIRERNRQFVAQFALEKMRSDVETPVFEFFLQRRRRNSAGHARNTLRNRQISEQHVFNV